MASLPEIYLSLQHANVTDGQTSYDGRGVPTVFITVFMLRGNVAPTMYHIPVAGSRCTLLA